LFLELKIVGLAVRFGFRGHGGFSFSCSPPLVHPVGGTSKHSQHDTFLICHPKSAHDRNK
jgi:hypothetical protein